MTVQFVSFGTKQYEVVVHRAYGTAYILRHCDNHATHLMTCHEGWLDYCQLKRAWRRNRQEFHRLCATHSYYP
jgi:hypothetical protein